MKIIRLEPKKFSEKIFQMKGISKKAVEEHLKLYQGYINKYNEIQEKLSQLIDDDFLKANQTYSLVRELKVELSFAWGGVVNHEIYFGHLGGEGKISNGALFKQIEKDFGSFENYKKDLKATGLSARGWVWTAWNEKEKRLFNYLGDAQNTFPVWYAKPILALDVYEHAYFMDFGSNRGNYIDVFFENLDWEEIEKNFKKIYECCCENNCKCNEDCQC
ncbi:MAG: Fe-Mn family superoxide dismutase [Patescibacteria group bacterium]|nr:Fe-Mn family superoxide dismutase [Patescibacteria group bacterium]